MPSHRPTPEMWRIAQRMLVLFALLCVSALPGAASQQQVLTVGMEQNPPICFFDQKGVAQGISVEILNEVARREGWHISYRNCVWEQCLQNLADGKLDLLVGIGHTSEREKQYSFSRETAVVNWAQVYVGKQIKAVSPPDLAGKRIALVPSDLHGAAFLDTLQRFNITAKIVQTASYGETVKAVAEGRADAGVISRIFPLSATESSKLIKTPIIFNPIQSRYATPLDRHQEILDSIDQHLAAMKADKGSAYYRILEQQLGVPGGQGIPQWIIWTLAGLVGLLTLFGLGNLFCTLKIKKKTAELTKEISQHHQTSLALLNREQQLQTIIATTGEAYLLMDATQSAVLDVNQSFCSMLGYEREEVVGKTPTMFVAEENQDGCRLQLALIEPGTHRSYDMLLTHCDGHQVAVHCTTTKLPEEEGFDGNIFAFMTDISERLDYEAQLLHQTHHDLLTGLPNRLLLHDRINQAILKGKRTDDFLVVFLLDLDNFKVVNDTLGHATGDELLQKFATRISEVLRQGDTFARLGGDEFVIVPAGVTCNQDVVQVARRIFDQLAQPFDISGYELFVTVSIGIARYPDDGATAEALLKHADAAMYLAKREGRNDFRFFTRELDITMHKRLTLESKLRRALERQEFELYYQPQVNMASRRLTGVEALLRWHSDEQLISPVDFIPVLEETGMILSVGSWVLQEACKAAASWQRHDLTISVNLSARQFQQQNLVAQVENILHQTGLKPQRLVLELTESLLMECGRDTLTKLEQLKKLGVVLSIDDFGTGYSSLSYLASLPIHELKIDRSFVHNLPDNDSDAAIVLALTTLASSLGLHVVVEGVETSEQAAFLRKAGLEKAQGFLYSRPLDCLMLQKLLQLPEQIVPQNWGPSA